MAVTIFVKQNVYKVDTISRDNDKAWVVIGEAVDKAREQTPNEPVTVDFTGITLIEPWRNHNFREFMAKRTANLKVYNSADVADYIKTMCLTGGMGDNRVVDITIKAPEAKSQFEIQAEQRAIEWQDIIEVDSNDPTVAVINISKKIDQISSEKTIAYLDKAIDLYHKNNPGVSKYVIKSLGMSVAEHSLDAIGHLIVDKQATGVYVKLQNNDKEVENESRMYAAICSQGKYTAENRVETIKNSMKPGYCGLLMVYATSRGVDRMGRTGKGEIRTNTPAIFQGLTRNNDGYSMKFKMFTLDTFCTREHWAIEHDGDVNQVKCREIEIPVMDCGLYGIYLGRSYHFSEPMQYHNGRENGTIMQYKFNENGGAVKENLTIPEFIKRVFDDRGIEYDRTYLDNCIARTEKTIIHNDGKFTRI